MSIRVYLVGSYLALVLLLVGGLWVMGYQVTGRLTQTSQENAEKGAQRTIAVTSQIAENLLTVYGEKIVTMKVQGVARGLALRLKGMDLTDYAKLRQNDTLRRVATQGISTPEGEVGHISVYDSKGEIIFHRLLRVEGKNVLSWQQEAKEMHDLIQRSFTEEQVSGYFEFKDSSGRKRKRFSARAHVPGTPFIASAAVNLDDFFEPAQEKIRAASQQIMANAKENIRKNNERARRRLTLVGLGMGGVLAVAGLVTGLFFARSLTRPVEALAEGVRQVGEGNFAVAVPETGVKEVVQLAQEFNRLGAQLTEYIEKRDFIRDTFGRYVTREVVKKLLEDREALELGGEIREVSILMNDLRGFTALTAEMPPQTVITFLNRYLGKMIEVLLEHRAVIDEIMGDGILAFFGAPEPMEDHPARAVACALALQLAMDEVNAENAADGIPFLEMGVAVNTGSVVVGNIGSERRTKYSVVGSHVNFTSRIEAMATGGQVLVSSSTYERVKDLVEVREVLQGQFKGVPGTVNLYNIKGIWGPYSRALRDRDEQLHPLVTALPVRFRKLKDKVAVGEEIPAALTHLSDIGGTLRCTEPLMAWEDIIMMLLDAGGNELPGRVYAKITAVKEGTGGQAEARLRITSAPPDLQQILMDLPRRTDG